MRAWAALCTGLMLLAPLGVHAGTVNVEGEGGPNEELLLSDAVTSAPLMRGLDPVPCCFIGADALARDNATDRTWVATSDLGVDKLLRFDAAGHSTALVLGADRFALALGHDALNGELVALQRNHNDQSLFVVRYNASTGAAIGERAVVANCCNLLAGTIAWSTHRRAFVALGTENDQPETMRIWVFPALAADSSAIVTLGERYAQALAVDPDDGNLYLLMHDPQAHTSQLDRVTTSGFILPSKISEADCCLVLAGRAVIGPGLPYLDAVTRGLSESTYTVRRFALADGSPVPMSQVDGSAGLLSDPVVPETFDNLFSDGFETTLP